MLGWVKKERSSLSSTLYRSYVALLTTRLPDGTEFFGGVERDGFLYVPRYADRSPVESRGGLSVGWGCTAPLRGSDDIAVWEALRAAHSGIIALACGKGKTVHSLRKVAHEKKKALIVVPTTDLALQWKEEILRWMTIDGRPVLSEEVGFYGMGKLQTSTPVIISTYHTLSAKGLPSSVHKEIGIVIHDEAHHLQAPTWYQCAGVGNHCRLALSATPEDDNGVYRMWYKHFGKVLVDDRSHERVPECFFVKYRTGLDIASCEAYDKTGELSIPMLYGVVGQLEKRNLLIRKLIEDALGRDRKVLCLSSSKAHCSTVLSLLEEHSAGLCTGDVKSTSTRKKNLNESDVVLATSALAKEGLDRKDLDTLVLMAPFVKKGMLTQAAGRILRDMGKDPLIIVIEDVDIPPFSHMTRKMKRIFKELNYTVRTTERYIDGVGDL